MKPPIRIHPGEIMREEFMLPLKLSANQPALELRVPASRIMISSFPDDYSYEFAVGG
jgi:plasmid maintenance system antidote protein VapI